MNHEAVRIFRTANPENVTCHTLRHAYASYVSELGYSDGTIGGLLGHRGRGVTWRDVPPKYGNWNTIYRRFRRWSEDGVWEAVQSPLLRSWLTVATTASIAPRFAPIFR
uniref:transposase n=1 Tax=Brucella grignonensis TaxID=94627 RepID=UPI0035BBA678